MRTWRQAFREPAGPALLPWSEVDAGPLRANISLVTRWPPVFGVPALTLGGAGVGRAASFNYRNVCTRGLDEAASAAGLNPPHLPKLTMHDVRHTFASHLIRQGIDPVRASRQLGHARPSITLDIYAHDFEDARGRDDIADKLSAAFAGLIGAESD